MIDDDSTMPAGATSEPASNCITARQTSYDRTRFLIGEST
jgi:hypothetical protein